jgi:hypothetical protein
MLASKEEGFLDGMLSLLASYMSELGGWVDLFEPLQESSGYHYAKYLGRCFFQGDPTVVVWVLGVTFAFIDSV